MKDANAYLRRKAPIFPAFRAFSIPTPRNCGKLPSRKWDASEFLSPYSFISFVANHEVTEISLPGEGLFDFPAMAVASEFSCRLKFVAPCAASGQFSAMPQEWSRDCNLSPS